MILLEIRILKFTGNYRASLIQFTSSRVFSFPAASGLSLFSNQIFSHEWYMFRPFHPSWLDYSNSRLCETTLIWFFPIPFYNISCSHCFPQHSVKRNRKKHRTNFASGYRKQILISHKKREMCTKVQQRNSGKATIKILTGPWPKQR